MDEVQNSIRISVIDDEPLTLELLTVILGDLAQVDVALGSQRSLAAALGNPPDLVLCDLTMPGIDRIEVCRRLRRDPQTAQGSCYLSRLAWTSPTRSQRYPPALLITSKKPLSVLLTSCLHRRYFNDRLASEWGRHWATKPMAICGFGGPGVILSCSMTYTVTSRVTGA